MKTVGTRVPAVFSFWCGLRAVRGRRGGPPGLRQMTVNEFEGEIARTELG
jgi:hypothetical protein